MKSNNTRSRNSNETSMIAAFEQMFEYHHHFNQRFIAEFEKHMDRLPERTYPLFCHVINAHKVWNTRITGAEPVGVYDVHSLGKCDEMDIENYRQTLSILHGYHLNQKIPYKNSKGEEFSNSIRDILFHVANHSTHHKGQIVSDFRQQGIPPLITDYIFYKR